MLCVKRGKTRAGNFDGALQAFSQAADIFPGYAVCEDGGVIKVPSFVQNVVDRVGAGDAFFSVTALAAVMGVENELLGFIGNVVGSLAVEILGNKKSIDRLSVQKYIVSLMK